MEQSLLGYLAERLPSHMVPGNVGRDSEVVWPFWYTFTFDFGNNPVYSPSTRQVQSVQVTQEAGLLLMGISRDANQYSSASDLAPLQITIRDRQSSRQFNSTPVPIQALGKNYRPSPLPTPLWFNPMAFIDIEMSSWVPEPTVTNVGSSVTTITLFGYRKRTPDGGASLSTVFAR